jgi:hypothetical protein
MIRVYNGPGAGMVFFFFLAGLILFVSIFTWGMATAIQLLLPLLIVLSYALIVVFVLGILPASLFKDLRPSLISTSMLISYALGATTWMVSFFLVIKAFGFLGMFLAFLFQFLAPIALAGALLNGSWSIAAHLSLWILFTFAMRFYSQWLSGLNARPQKKGDVIDVEATEVSKKG